MEKTVNPFTNYDWTGVSLMTCFKTYTTCAEFHHTESPDPHYQLGLKHHGKTDVNFNGCRMKYHDFTVMYLPKLEPHEGFYYDRHIVERGEGACVFFQSLHELPSEPFILSCESSPRVVELFYKLARLSSDGRSLEAMSVFYRLLAALNETVLSEGGLGALHERLAPALERIASEFTREYLDLSELAELCGMSPDYFRHSFKRTLGESPLEYISRLKIERAKQLLLSGMAVSEVSEAVGFASPNYFTRRFREATGLPPSRFGRE